MRIRILATPELGNRSYVVDDGTSSVVIDPQRDLDRLDPMLEQDVSHVLETHVHNDYVTGGHELARRTGAAYGVNAADDVSFERLPLTDGEELRSGSLSVHVLATPGHTPTHLSYVVHDLADPLTPPAVFSGGSLLYGTVGRTDLIAPELTRDLAVAQHASAHRLAALPDDAALYPTHGFGSFCAGGGASGAADSTIADERRHNLALTTPVVEFVDVLLASFTAIPSYYAHMAGRNRAAALGVDLSTPLQQTSSRRVADLMAAGAMVVDLRPGADFAADHVAGTVSIPLGTQFATYVGWMAPWGRPLVVLGEQPEQLDAARRQLTRIGVDDVAPVWGRVPELALTVSGERRSFRHATFADLAAERALDDVVVDVRRVEEHATARIHGAINIPLHELEDRHAELPAGTRLWLHCAGGFRAGTAASLLERHGLHVVHVDEGFDHAVALGLVVEEPADLAVDSPLERASA